MGLYSSTGTRYTTTTVPVTPWTDPDPWKTVTAQIISKKPFYGAEDEDAVEGTKEQILANVGDRVRTSTIASWFADDVVDTVTPATGAAAGGTVLTIRGHGLDGVTAVAAGGVACTALTIVSPSQITATTGVHAAGLVDVVLTDDSGTITVTGAFTYV